VGCWTKWARKKKLPGQRRQCCSVARHQHAAARPGDVPGRRPKIARVVDFVSTTEPDFVHELVNLKVEDRGRGRAPPAALKKRDELYETAVGHGGPRGPRQCVAYCKRAMGIGLRARAARLIDFMAEGRDRRPLRRFAGPPKSLISVEDWERMQGADAEAETVPRAPPVQEEPQTLAASAHSARRRTRRRPSTSR